MAYRHRLGALLLLALLSTLPVAAFASNTDGTIDSVSKYAKALETGIGSINFGTSAGNVQLRTQRSPATHGERR
jgi:hypothetical protein